MPGVLASREHPTGTWCLSSERSPSKLHAKSAGANSRFASRPRRRLLRSVPDRKQLIYIFRRDMWNQRLLITVALTFSSPACSLVHALENNSPLQDIAVVPSGSPRLRVRITQHQTSLLCHDRFASPERFSSTLLWHAPTWPTRAGLLCSESSTG